MFSKISKSVETIYSLNIHFQRNSVFPSQVLQVNLSQFWQIFLLQQPAYLHNIEEKSNCIACNIADDSLVPFASAIRDDKTF